MAPQPAPPLFAASRHHLPVLAHRLLQCRRFIDARVPWIRDRALDHAVEKEKHLLPFHSLKDFLVCSSSSSSSPSLRLAVIASRSAALRLPFRPIRFIRLFPAAFLESHPPPPSPPSPLISPSPALLSIHSEELRALSSSLPDAASRLLRLLMLCPRRRLPLPLLHRLRWDLGLPPDFPRSLLPDFPDFFLLSPSLSNPSDLELELVLYNKDLAVSAMEQFARRTGGYRKGTPLYFPLSFPSGFELEKKVRKWLDEWQKLPFISPYENASHLDPKSDLFDKWTVGMVHEVLSLFISKKTEKENLEMLAPHLGLRPGFKKVITHHPGIFYVSNKLRTHTVVLREAYRRDLLVEKHPLMGLRYQYIHLMRKGKEGGDASKDGKCKEIDLQSVNDGENLVDESKGEDEEEDWEGDSQEEEEEGFVGGAVIDTTDEESDDDDDDSVNEAAPLSGESSLNHKGENIGLARNERSIGRGGI
ncbi:putative plant organelle RNA recognition domain-containing protein [Dioscorea sansibarensis]